MQHALFRLLQSWQKTLDNSEYVGTVLVDLSNGYDCVPHDLLIAKLEAYGLDKISLHLLIDYLSIRKQRTKIGSSFIDWWDVVCGIPQGSILGPLLFNIFINDMLFFVSKSDICNFADNNALSSCGKMLGDILHNLKFDLGHILKWLNVNSLKPNPGKFQVNLFLGGNEIEKSQKVVLLGITIDDKLSFKTHIENIYRQAKNKLQALQRIR